ncbi:MAG: sulfatase-like hydrolase/transferase, partial [Planctomycetaceae bacterium]
MPRRISPIALSVLTAIVALALPQSTAEAASTDRPSRPNIVIILADDLGFSDVGCYGSEIATPNIDRLAANGIRFNQFYNCARCCPTRASILTGLYPHQTGVGHMLGAWNHPAYSGGINEKCATIAELLRTGGYRTYHVGKWHVGGVGKGDNRNHPMNRGFDHARGTGGGGSFFDLAPIYFDLKPVEWEPGEYATDAFTDGAVGFIDDHRREHAGKPFFLNVCYTAPHFPLHAKPEDIEKYVGKYLGGWDQLRARRYQKQQELGLLLAENCRLSPRDLIAQAWEDVSESDRQEWDRRMAVHAAMVDCMDQG